MALPPATRDDVRLTTDVALSPAAVLPLVRGRFAVPYLWEDECGSTQDLLRGSGLPEGAVAAAEHQTSGRGRLGRRWEDRPGSSALTSVLLRPPTGAQLPQLSLVVGLATAEAIETVTRCPAAIKWPNDVVLDGAKVAGVLLEGDADAVVCGIGINVRQAPDELPTNTPLPATSLGIAAGEPVDRALLLATVLDTLERRYDTWRHDGIRPLLPAIEARNALRGRRARAGELTGVVGRLTEDGLITLDVDGLGERSILSGELQLL